MSMGLICKIIAILVSISIRLRSLLLLHHLHHTLRTDATCRGVAQCIYAVVPQGEVLILHILKEGYAAVEVEEGLCATVGIGIRCFLWQRVGPVEILPVLARHLFCHSCCIGLIASMEPERSKINIRLFVRHGGFWQHFLTHAQSGERLVLLAFVEQALHEDREHTAVGLCHA